MDTLYNTSDRTKQKSSKNFRTFSYNFFFPEKDSKLIINQSSYRIFVVPFHDAGLPGASPCRICQQCKHDENKPACDENKRACAENKYVFDEVGHAFIREPVFDSDNRNMSDKNATRFDH